MSRQSFRKEEADNNGEIKMSNVNETFFQLFKSITPDDTHLLLISKFQKLMLDEGFDIETDVRFKKTNEQIKLMSPCKDVEINFKQFMNLIQPAKDVILRALEKNLIVSDFSKFTKSIEILYRALKYENSGEVATYIPELAKVNPNYWGLALCTIDGQKYTLGDYDVPFTVQSTGKPFIYGLVLELLDADLVHKYVGHEPTNKKFNAILLDSKNRPHNPMVNSGAILICSLLQTLALTDLTHSEKHEYICNYYKNLCAGGYVNFKNSVYISEREKLANNKAITYFMKSHKAFPKKNDVGRSLDFYIETCAIEVTCESLSIMAGTLANGGICPLTGREILSSHNVRHVLSLMQSCGMYDYSGKFAFQVGLPAKSGVGGSVALIVPGYFGIALFSPRLDQNSCSARSLKFCIALINQFMFHPYDNVVNKFKALRIKEKKIFQDQKISCSRACSAFDAVAANDLMKLAGLLSAGCDICVVDHLGQTLLHVATAFAYFEIVRFLIENCNQLIEMKDCVGRTPRDIAAIMNFVDILEYFQKMAPPIKEPAKEDLKSNKLDCINMPMKNRTEQLKIVN